MDGLALMEPVQLVIVQTLDHLVTLVMILEYVHVIKDMLVPNV